MAWFAYGLFRRHEQRVSASAALPARLNVSQRACDDAGFHYDIYGTASHDKMLDVVTANKQQLAAAPDGGDFDDIGAPVWIAAEQMRAAAQMPLGPQISRTAADDEKK